ncbi:MAG: J domain-containing protein [Spirochaetaceae bacterium]|nr:MAG: J domain-containing protein [Spirochaetaceae bacterium]
MQSYYDLLQVEISCSPEELRTAFRRRAKELHPDVTSAAESVETMRLLIQAYRTLSDPILREDYDRRHGVHLGAVRFDYREFLRERCDDLTSQARLIFFDLLHNSAEQALELYGQLGAGNGFRLQDHLDREDFMDCAYLLAEEYERRGELNKAYDLLVDIVRFERERPYFRHFFEEVTARLRSIVCFRMPAILETDQVIRRLDELVDLHFTRKDTAFFLKKAAELHLENDNVGDAAECLRRGLELDQKLSGHKKLLEKIARYA